MLFFVNCPISLGFAKILMVYFSVPWFEGNQLVKINSNGAYYDVPTIKRAIYCIVTCRSMVEYFCWLCLSMTVPPGWYQHQGCWLDLSNVTAQDIPPIWPGSTLYEAASRSKWYLELDTNQGRTVPQSNWMGVLFLNVWSPANAMQSKNFTAS